MDFSTILNLDIHILSSYLCIMHVPLCLELGLGAKFQAFNSHPSDANN